MTSTDPTRATTEQSDRTRDENQSLPDLLARLREENTVSQSQPCGDGSPPILPPSAAALVEDVRAAQAMLDRYDAPTLDDGDGGPLSIAGRIEAMVYAKAVQSLGPIADIAAERRRQVEGEGWAPERIAELESAACIASDGTGPEGGASLESAAAYNARFDPADEAGQEAFNAGWKCGWMFARYDGCWDDDAEEDFRRNHDGVATGEAWEAHRDQFFARLPLAAVELAKGVK